MEGAQESTDPVFKEIVENARAGIYILKEGKFAYSNNTLSEITGYSREDLSGKTEAVFIHPEDKERVLKNRAKLLDGSQGKSKQDFRCILWNGKIISVEALEYKINYLNGASLVGFILDVTESAWELSQLRQFSDIISKMKSGFYVYRLEDKYDDSSFVLINANPAATLSLGLERHSLIGKRIDECFPGLREKGIVGRFAEVVRTGIPFEITDFEYEDARVAKRNFSFKAFSLPDNCLCIVFEDVTERVRAEASLKRSEENLKKAQKFSKVGSWTWDIGNNRLEWSDEMYVLFGIEKSAFSGRLEDVIGKAIHPDDRSKVEASNLSVINEGKAIPLEYRIIGADGQTRVVWAEAGELLLNESGKPSVLSGFVRDITAEKNLEKEMKLRDYVLEKSQEIANFGSFRWDFDTRTFELSSQLRKILDISQKEAVSIEAFLQKISESERLMASSAFSRAIETNGVVEFSVRTVPIGGTEKTLQIYGKKDDAGGSLSTSLIGVVFEGKT